ncbi:MAG: 16S rRNA (guanine(527)-N(7))-methyltransferase RsmG [Acholeplasmataceae bacterium]|jgi:16S rRNA (guanine527-N7)-methyltransferase|nr:16S rRNA (guanine(527)-N(7))-methyltransferase RsmG [Acholeplasmataceae bacterium]
MNFKRDVEANLGIRLSDEQMMQFNTYYEYLIEYNKITNLTRIIDRQEVYYKHFYDSLTLSNVIKCDSIVSIADMGSGAGFPSIPLKIAYPHLKITIIDSLGKRITFLEHLIYLLNLTDVHLIHDRVEIFAKNMQQTYDLVTARALGSLALIVEMGLPMVKVNGFFIAPKGINFEQEVNEAKKAIHILGAEISKIESFDLPYEYGQRANILIKKVKHVEGYPRSFAQMKHKAL